MNNSLSPSIALPGALYAWRYLGENPLYRGWHLSGDEAGCNALIGLLEELEATTEPPRQVILQEATARVARVTGRGFVPAQSLQLRYERGLASLWETGADGDTLLLRFGDRELALLQTALLRVIKGEGAFALGDAQDAQLLHFWPAPH